MVVRRLTLLCTVVSSSSSVVVTMDGVVDDGVGGEGHAGGGGHGVGRGHGGAVGQHEPFISSATRAMVEGKEVPSTAPTQRQLHWRA